MKLAEKNKGPDCKGRAMYCYRNTKPLAEVHKSKKANDLLPPGDEQEQSPAMEKKDSRFHAGPRDFAPPNFSLHLSEEILTQGSQDSKK